MRIALILAVIALAGCAAEKLASTPPAGVDLSGLWKLNEADSDDPQRLMQSQLASATASAGTGGSTGSSRRGSPNGGGRNPRPRPQRPGNALRGGFGRRVALAGQECGNQSKRGCRDIHFGRQEQGLPAGRRTAVACPCYRGRTRLG